MVETSGPSLLIVGGDAKRLQWLTYHIASQWHDAEVVTLSIGEFPVVERSVAGKTFDAVIVLADFADEAEAATTLSHIGRLSAANPALHCMVLADNGNERAAVSTMKSGARDYLPLSDITRDEILSAVGEAAAKRRADAQPYGAETADVPGPRVAGYAIVKEIATSNFSSVFLARSERLRRNVVLKVMTRGESKREREDAERFEREHQIISSITHRAIAEIYDFGSQADQIFLAMEYFPCGDLRDRLCNPLSVDESLFYLRTIAEALRVIHVFGILHRDLKPANVMLREDNSPVLIDFGLARRSKDDTGTTGAGQVLGSPYYISPEQAQGQRVDPRTDLYSLGVIFYEMLTGERPYLGRTAISIMAQHAHSPVPVLPEAMAAQQPLLERLMAKRQNARYASADELLADLGPAVSAVA